MEQKKQRIAKIIAASVICSRRDAEKKILNGEVMLNGEKILSPAVNVSETDEIIVNGIYGKIKNIKDNVIDLEISKNITIKIDKNIAYLSKNKEILC